MAQKLSLRTNNLAFRLEALIKALKPYEIIEIKLNDNLSSQISIVVKSTYKEVINIDKGGAKESDL